VGLWVAAPPIVAPADGDASDADARGNAPALTAALATMALGGGCGACAGSPALRAVLQQTPVLVAALWVPGREHDEWARASTSAGAWGSPALSANAGVNLLVVTASRPVAEAKAWSNTAAADPGVVERCAALAQREAGAGGGETDSGSTVVMTTMVVDPLVRSEGSGSHVRQWVLLHVYTCPAGASRERASPTLVTTQTWRVPTGMPLVRWSGTEVAAVALWQAVAAAWSVLSKSRGGQTAPLAVVSPGNVVDLPRLRLRAAALHLTSSATVALGDHGFPVYVPAGAGARMPSTAGAATHTDGLLTGASGWDGFMPRVRVHAATGLGWPADAVAACTDGMTAMDGHAWQRWPARTTDGSVVVLSAASWTALAGANTVSTSETVQPVRGGAPGSSTGGAVRSVARWLTRHYETTVLVDWAARTPRAATILPGSEGGSARAGTQPPQWVLPHTLRVAEVAAIAGWTRDHWGDGALATAGRGGVPDVGVSGAPHCDQLARTDAAAAPTVPQAVACASSRKAERGCLVGLCCAA
jgi:hypothetical protein